MKLAGYSKISATASLISTPFIKHPTLSKNTALRKFPGKITINNTERKHRIYNASEGNFTEKKIYIQVFLNRYRLVGCVDSGSDLTLMHLSLYEKIKFKSHPLEPSDIPYITSFSDNNIAVKGKIKCKLQLKWDHPGISVVIYVIRDIPNQTPFLLGNDLLRSGLGEISYSNSPLGPIPEVRFKTPIPFECIVFYTAPRELFLCKAECTLEPNETKDVEFLLQPAAPVIRTDHILITALQWDPINLLPSRSDLEFVPHENAYSAVGRIINLRNSRIRVTVVGKYELINTYRAIPVNKEYKKCLMAALKKYPIGREVLENEYNFSNNTSFENSLPKQITIFQTNVQVSDSTFDLADTIISKEPTYSGEGEINEEIIEPHGIDLPTVIYKDANEAIDLNKQSPEIRPYLKKIFLEKHPSAVALHAMDSGNFSLTLGYTKLRLREGETLPRARRIFHVSPSDQRHLDDICEFLIKYGYIRRTPTSPSGCHLYGLSAYLVPRAKPGTLGRLVVDFSPINPLIETPSSVIPEISATLQMLQGKAMFTSLDLRYAFMGLRMDEQSSSLTTFLTPSGSYQWISLPTGAANSPAYFTDSMNRILHYTPVLDENGKEIYDEPNVVRQKRDPLISVANYMDDILITSTLMPTFEETLQEHFKIVEKATDRLAYHGAKINVMKCTFAKSKILFLGWYITQNFIIADPRRVEKVRDFKFPESKKAMRAFLGLVNSMRRVISIRVIDQVSILTPLTSSKSDFVTKPEHLVAFKQIKDMLISEPLFANLIDEKAEKFLFCDAATSTSTMGAVLLQKIKGCNEKIVPTTLDLDDEVHRIIFDKELQYEPAKLYTSLPIVLPKPSVTKTRPPNILPERKLMGYPPDKVVDSFFWSTISILAIHNCVLPSSTLEYRKLAVKKLRNRKGALNDKIKDFTFNLNYKDYQDYISAFLAGKAGMDPELYLAEAQT